MAIPEHVEIVEGGRDAIRAWRESNPTQWLDLIGANFTEADFVEADLMAANLTDAKLFWADLRGANLQSAKLQRANLQGANLQGANLQGANLDGANLGRADLRWADFCGAILSGANLKQAVCGSCTFGNADFSAVRGLGEVSHAGPSLIGVDTFERSGGNIPEAFLRGCGLSPWEILNVKLYDPSLTAAEISELQYQIFNKRAHGPMYLGGVFISYSHTNSKFVDKIYERLLEAEASVWLDRHDMDAGSLQKQVARAIRMNDIVLLVLSEDSVQSDWVENELDMARRKEKEEGRGVLCPVALDDSWKEKAFGNESEERALWRTVARKNVLDFSKWKTKAFNGPFEKLLRGLKVNYPKQDDA